VSVVALALLFLCGGQSRAGMVVAGTGISEQVGGSWGRWWCGSSMWRASRVRMGEGQGMDYERWGAALCSA